MLSCETILVSVAADIQLISQQIHLRAKFCFLFIVVFCVVLNFFCLIGFQVRYIDLTLSVYYPCGCHDKLLANLQVIKDATQGSESGKTVSLFVLDALICIDHDRFILNQLQSRGFLRSCFIRISNFSSQVDITCLL